MARRSLHVLVVDDSAVVRESMTSVLSGDDITVTTAPDPIAARRRIANARPDVILLDLEMPRESGLSFLRELMATDPIPVVICSSYGTAGSREALEALREGAVEVVAKPRLGVREFVHESKILLTDAVQAAARARLRRPAPMPAPRPAPVLPPRPPCAKAADGAVTPSTRVIAIAASTGGPQSLLEVLSALPRDIPGIVIVQHMPAGFTAAFARHLDHECALDVKEAEHGDLVQDGRVLIAPGDFHLAVVPRQGHYAVEVVGGPLLSRHRPSANVLFHSAARSAGPDAMGIIMTGMGDDGAAGLAEMHVARAHTVAQDEASCVVFGMPREAIAAGAATDVIPLSGIAPAILQWARASRVR